MPRTNPQIYFVGGSNELIVKTEAQKLAVQLAGKDADVFGLETIDGQANNTDEALAVLRRLREAVNTLPFFGTRKLVWLKNTNLFGDLAFARESKALVEALNDFAGELKNGLPEGVRLLISATAVDKRRTLWKTVEGLAETRLFDLPEADKRGREQLAAFIRDSARGEGKTISADALELLVELAGFDYRTCAQEIQKLCLYVGERKEITERDVEAVASATAAVSIWKLMDAIGARDAATAMDALNNLLAHREAVLRILMQVAKQVRWMLLFRDLLQRGAMMVHNGAYPEFKSDWERLPAAVTAHFPPDTSGSPPHPYWLYRCALAARRFSEAELVAGLDNLLQANHAIVTTGIDDRLVLEEAILKMIAGAQGEQAETISAGRR